MVKIRRLLMMLLFILAAACVANAQSHFEFQGNTIVSKSNKSKDEATKTKFTWKDNKGKEYPVYISNSGSCFIIKISSKTGKEYKNYLGPEISQQICKELNVEYKGKKGK